MVNVMARASRQLLRVSTGLLIEGCPDATDRQQAVQMRNRNRMRRAVDCEQACMGTPQYEELCQYDCMTADASGVDANVSIPLPCCCVWSNRPLLLMNFGVFWL